MALDFRYLCLLGREVVCKSPASLFCPESLAYYYDARSHSREYRFRQDDIDRAFGQTLPLEADVRGGG